MQLLLVSAAFGCPSISAQATKPRGDTQVWTEFHIHRPAPNFIQYRNRMQIERRVKRHQIGIDPYIADEVLYDSIANAWTRNRFYAGAAKKINRHFTIELYYLKQNDSHSHPGDINALGTRLKFRL